MVPVVRRRCLMTPSHVEETYVDESGNVTSPHYTTDRHHFYYGGQLTGWFTVATFTPEDFREHLGKVKLGTQREVKYHYEGTKTPTEIFRRYGSPRFTHFSVVNEEGKEEVYLEQQIFLSERFDQNLSALLEDYFRQVPEDSLPQEISVHKLNQILEGRDLYFGERFQEINIRDQAKMKFGLNDDGDLVQYFSKLSLDNNEVLKTVKHQIATSQGMLEKRAPERRADQNTLLLLEQPEKLAVLAIADRRETKNSKRREKKKTLSEAEKKSQREKDAERKRSARQDQKLLRTETTTAGESEL
jgi:hypothetical protein